MKKYLAILSSVMFVTFTFLVGCEGKNSDLQSNSATNETTLIALVSPSSLQSDCISSKDMVVDKAFEDWYIQRYGKIVVPEPKEELTVVFDGKEYHGKYTRTVSNSLGMRSYFDYSSDQGLFTVDAVSGKLVMIIIGHQYVNVPISDQLFSKCENEAQRIATQYIDTSCFTFEKEIDDVGMQFYYNQYIGGIKTENYLHIVFDSKGRLTAFENNVTDGYKLVSQAELNNSEEMVSTFNAEKTEQLVLTTSINLLAQNDISQENVKEHEISEKALYVMPDGKLVKAYSYTAELKDENPIKDEDGNLLYSPKHFNVLIAVLAEQVF